MKPTLEDFKMAVCPDVAYEEYIEKNDLSWADESYDEFEAKAKFQFIETIRDREWESYVIKENETDEHWMAYFDYSSWEGVSFEWFSEEPRRVEPVEVLVRKWKAVNV